MMTRRLLIGRFIFWIIAVGGVVLGMSIALIVKPVTRHLGDALATAEKCVADRLVAPSTAKFPPFRKITVTNLGGGLYVVTGYVDAQDAVGAQTRTHYMAKVRYNEPDDTWSLVSLDGL